MVRDLGAQVKQYGHQYSKSTEKSRDHLQKKKAWIGMQQVKGNSRRGKYSQGLKYAKGKRTRTRRDCKKGDEQGASFVLRTGAGDFSKMLEGREEGQCRTNRVWKVFWNRRSAGINIL